MALTQTRLDADPRLGTSVAKRAVTGPWQSVQAETGAFSVVTASTEMRTSTPAVDDVSTRVATTEFVTNALSSWITGGGGGGASMTTDEKIKLAGISPHATATSVAATTAVGTPLAVVTVDGSAVTVYSGLQGTVLTDSATGVTNSTGSNSLYLNTVVDNAVLSSINLVGGDNIAITASADGQLTIHASSPEISPATSATMGLMSAEDKAKLDAIEHGAQVNTVLSVRGSTEDDGRTGNVVLDYSDVGAAAEEHGNHVPELLASDEFTFLRCDNVWSKIDVASAEADGLMSSTQVSTLAQTATTVDELVDDVSTMSTDFDDMWILFGNYPYIYNVTVDENVLTLHTLELIDEDDVEDDFVLNTSTVTLPVATDSTAGVMSAEDKAALDVLTTLVDNGALVTATSSTNGLMSSGDKAALDVLAGLVDNGSLAAATTTAPGLMTAEDRVLLNRLANLVASEGGLIVPSSRGGGNVWIE